MFVKDKKLDDCIWRDRKDDIYDNYDKEGVFINEFTKKVIDEYDKYNCLER